MSASIFISIKNPYTPQVWLFSVMYLKPLLSIFDYTDSCKSLLYVILLIHISDYLDVFLQLTSFLLCVCPWTKQFWCIHSVSVDLVRRTVGCYLVFNSINEQCMYFTISFLRQTCNNEQIGKRDSKRSQSSQCCNTVSQFTLII